MTFALILFKTMQLANIFAGLAVGREALPVLWSRFAKWIKDYPQWPMEDPILLPRWVFACAGVAVFLIPVLAFWRRIWDHMVLWLGFDASNSGPAILAMLLLFGLCWFFHFYLKNNWPLTKRLALIILGGSFALTILETAS